MTTDNTPNVAIFCDFENVAIGVRDARYDPFDISLVLERILDKGKVVFKKAYADWDRFKSSKRSMHEASFELVEIPHVSYSGKNSADIRLVVDALDLSYTKNHVDVFVIVSGDSDFSPLVSKLRENNKVVIGLGVKNSSSDLLIENCDEFIFYDDLVRGRRSSTGRARRPRRRGGRGGGSREETRTAEETSGVPRDSSKGRRPEARSEGGKVKEAKKPTDASGRSESSGSETSVSAAEKSGDPVEAMELVLDVVESLFKDRDGNLWGSMVKQVIKRKRPQFAESYYGYRSFNQLLEDAAKHELLEIIMDEKSGGYVIHGFGEKA